MERVIARPTRKTTTITTTTKKDSIWNVSYHFTFDSSASAFLTTIGQPSVPLLHGRVSLDLRLTTMTRIKDFRFSQRWCCYIGVFCDQKSRLPIPADFSFLSHYF